MNGCSVFFAALIRDSSNVVHPIRNLRVVIHDMNSVQPPSTLLSQKLLSDVVSNALPLSTSSADILPNTIVTVGSHDLQLSGKTLTYVYCIYSTILHPVQPACSISLTSLN